MKKEDCIIVGGGPCGLAAAIALKQIGKNPLVIEKGNVVNALFMNIQLIKHFLVLVKN